MEALNIQKIKNQLINFLMEVNKFKMLIFLLFVLILYGYIYSRINTLYNQAPSQTAVSAINDPIKKALVDKKVVNEINSLQNNSVNVKSLFNQARTNPFQETANSQ